MAAATEALILGDMVTSSPSRRVDAEVPSVGSRSSLALRSLSPQRGSSRGWTSTDDQLRDESRRRGHDREGAHAASPPAAKSAGEAHDTPSLNTETRQLL